MIDTATHPHRRQLIYANSPLFLVRRNILACVFATRISYFMTPVQVVSATKINDRLK